MLPYPTTDANVLQLPQWNNIALAAWSLTWVVPTWYYDGSETITASDTDLTAGNIKSWVNIFGTVWTYNWSLIPLTSWLDFVEVRLRNSGTFNGTRQLNTAIYDNTTTLIGISELDSSGPSHTFVVQEFNKTTQVVLAKNFTWIAPNYQFTDSIYYKAWEIIVNYHATNIGSQPFRGAYNIWTDTRVMHTSGHDTTWTLLTSTELYLWYTAQFYLLFNNAATQYTFTWLHLT